VPRKVMLIRVFVASPTDVAEERDLLEDIVKELNLTWGKNFPFRLELVRWETHAYPSIGTDPQAVVNDQIGEGYDIFVGVLWARFGTPTPRSGSGTEEEFERAHARWREDPNQVRVMFYFKDAAISPSEIDPDQLSKVKAFRDRLGNEGVLHWKYKSREDFTSFLRMHLSRHAQELYRILESSTPGASAVVEKPPLGTSVTEPAENIEDDADQLGFIDLLEIGLERSSSVNEVLRNMQDAMETLTQRMTERSAEIDEFKTSQNLYRDLPQVRRVLNRAAADMEQFAARMEKEIPILSESYSGTIDVFARATAMVRDFAPHDMQAIQGAIEAVSQLETVLSEARDAITYFRQSVASLPRMTTLVNHAKRRTVKVLDKLEKEIASELSLTSAAKATFHGLQPGEPTTQAALPNQPKQ